MMEPLFLPSASHQLFAAYHPPDGAERSTVFVVCPPLGIEANFAQSTLVQLALRLSRRGHAVFRFDYRGTGDSSGDYESCSIRGWREDLDRVIETARARCPNRPIGLIGLRLGATLAALAASADPDISTVIQWCPIASGRAYLRELRRRHQLWLKRVTIQPEALPELEPAIAVETLGFSMTSTMASELEAIDLANEAEIHATPSLLVDAPARTPSDTAWHQKLAERNTAVRQPNDQSFWFSLGALVPHEDLDAIVTWVGENCG